MGGVWRGDVRSLLRGGSVTCAAPGIWCAARHVMRCAARPAYTLLRKGRGVLYTDQTTDHAISLMDVHVHLRCGSCAMSYL